MLKKQVKRVIKKPCRYSEDKFIANWKFTSVTSIKVCIDYGDNMLFSLSIQ
jgi:hypothetical protein